MSHTHLIHFLLLLLISVFVTSNQVTNIGDSWGTGGFKFFKKFLKKIFFFFFFDFMKVLKFHPTFKVTRYARGGTTAKFWSSSQGEMIIQNMYKENHNLTKIWFTLGGNGK